MPASETLWTAEMALALPEDGKRWEVLDGELVEIPMPSIQHQTVLGNFLIVLGEYVRKNRLGWAMFSPSDIVLTPHRLVQPDVFVIPSGPRGEPRQWSDITELLLAVEVSSPETAHVDRVRKRRIYQEQGVSEYWIADLNAQLIERWRPDDTRSEIKGDVIYWQPSVSIPPLRIELSALFN